MSFNIPDKPLPYKIGIAYMTEGYEPTESLKDAFWVILDGEAQGIIPVSSFNNLPDKIPVDGWHMINSLEDVGHDSKDD